MTDVQQKLYELLIKFDKRCKEYGVVYYLGGGSALGALRHKGFLPWDDDVDIYITRENYKKIIAVQEEFFDDKFVLVNNDNFPRYRNTLVRCVDTDTTAITKARIVDGAPKGQFIELFILDPLPNEGLKRELWLKKHWIYTELFSVAFLVANDRIFEYVDKELYEFYRQQCLELGEDVVLKKLERELFNINEEDADEFCSRWGMRNLIYKKEWFGKPRYVPFEDTKLPVATYAENVARFDYGDKWMYIPKIDEQRTHSFCENMSVPYTYFVEDYTQFFDEDVVYNSYSWRKRKMLSHYYAAQEALILKKKMYSRAVALSFSNGPRVDVERLLAKGRLNDITRHYQKWYDLQFAKNSFQTKFLVPLAEREIYIALIPVLNRGDFSVVREYLTMRDKLVGLTEELRELLNIANSVRSVYIAIDNHNHKLAQKILLEVTEKAKKIVPGQFNIRILNLKYAIDADDFKKNKEKIRIALASLLKDSNNNPEVLYLIAELNFKLGDYRLAKKDYLKVAKKTRHGFILLHIKDRLQAIEERL